jgi:hypothetical protein
MIKRGFFILLVSFLLITMVNAQYSFNPQGEVTEAPQPTYRVPSPPPPQQIINPALAEPVITQTAPPIIQQQAPPPQIIIQQPTQQIIQQPIIQEVHETVQAAIETFIQKEETPVLKQPSLVIEPPKQEVKSQLTKTEQIVIEEQPQITLKPSQEPVTKKVEKKITEYSFVKEQPVKTAKIKLKTLKENNIQTIKSVHIDLGN